MANERIADLYGEISDYLGLKGGDKLLFNRIVDDLKRTPGGLIF